jgi:hypothetical protein
MQPSFAVFERTCGPAVVWVEGALALFLCSPIWILGKESLRAEFAVVQRIRLVP